MYAYILEFDSLYCVLKHYVQKFKKKLIKLMITNNLSLAIKEYEEI